MAMISVAFLTVAALCLLSGVARQRAWRAKGREGVTPLLPCAVSLACAFTFIAPVVQDAAGSVVPGVGRLLSNCCTLIAAHGFRDVLGYLNATTEPVDGRRARRQRGMLLAVLAVLVAAFSLGERENTPLGLFDYRGDLALTVYVVVYAVFLALTMVQMLRLTAHAVTRTRGRLRVGMAVVAAGCAMGTVYAADRVYGAVGGYTGFGPPADLYCAGPFAGLACTLDVGLPALSGASIAVGISIPFLVGVPTALRRLVVDARLARDLHPLWRALCAALPQIALTAPGAVGGRMPRLDAGLRLYRRTVEVRDAALLLQRYRSAADTAEHTRRAERAGLVGAAADTAVEAADLATAIERHRRDAAGAPTAPRIPPPLPPPAPVPQGAAADDARAEARWLAQVSAAFARRRIEPVRVGADAAAHGVGQNGSTPR